MKVVEFHKAFEFPIYKDYETQIQDYKISKLRCDLIYEEGVKELGEAYRNNDMIEIIDAICDTLYVIYGAGITYNFNLDEQIDILMDNFLITREFNDTNYNLCEKLIKMKYNFTRDELGNIITHGIISQNMYDIYKRKILNTKSYTDVNKYDLETCIINLYLIEHTIELISSLEQRLRDAIQTNKNMNEFNSLLLNILIKVYELVYLINIDLTYKKQKTFDVNSMFSIVHDSNMSKLCKSEEEAIKTVEFYEQKYKIYKNMCDMYGPKSTEAYDNYVPYDSPYYYSVGQNLFAVKNKSTGKALKSINYTPVDLKY